MKYTVFADTNSGFVEQVKGFRLSQRNQHMLVDQRDFVYHEQRRYESSGKVTWRCKHMRRLKCRARCISKNHNILMFINDHNHVPEED